MNNKPLHVLAIGSFAVHGTASLKTFIAFLGEKILPVPSLLLNGLTNMSLIRKFEPPFQELLQSTFDLAANRELSLILYIGYLGKGEQAETILELIDSYKHLVDTIIIDPVCGDHGRTYVPPEVIERWPLLVSKAAIVFPNVTELKLLTGNAAGALDDTEYYADRFRKIYPGVQLVVTSVKNKDKIGITYFDNRPVHYLHEALPINYGGSGDAFVAQFILNHFYRQKSFSESLELAASQTFNIIKNSIEKGSDDLILELT
jgi:pyridoxine kinase